MQSLIEAAFVLLLTGLYTIPIVLGVIIDREQMAEARRKAAQRAEKTQ